MRGETRKDLKVTNSASDEQHASLRDLVMHRPARESLAKRESESPVRRTLAQSLVARNSSDARGEPDKNAQGKKGSSPGEDGKHEPNEELERAVRIFEAE